MSCRGANCPDLPRSSARSNSHSFLPSVFFESSAASHQPQQQQQQRPCDVLYNELIAATQREQRHRSSVVCIVCEKLQD